MRRTPGFALHALQKGWTHSVWTQSRSPILRVLQTNQCQHHRPLLPSRSRQRYSPGLSTPSANIQRPTDLRRDLPALPALLCSARSKNASHRPPEAFKAHENSHIWLVSGDQAFFDLRQPKGLYYLRVNVGSGTLLKDADFNITTRPGTFPIESAPCCLVVHEML